MSGYVRRCRIYFGPCSARTAQCRDVYDEVFLVSRRVRQSRDVLGNVVLESGLVRQGQISVGTCSARSTYCLDLFDDAG